MIFDKKIKIVIGLDFGTSRSGYAYAFVDDKRIVPRVSWPGQNVPYVKTKTQILYSPEGQAIAYGYEAATLLAEKRLEGTAQGYDFLTNFKMQLFESQEKTPDGPLMHAKSGNTYSVVEVIADYLRFVKETALQEALGASSGTLKETEIGWCLTVPAIWTNDQKYLMRLAAQKAGIIGTSDEENDRLILAYEPEVAAMYCQAADAEQLQPGQTIMIVDCGGGTIDLTLYKVEGTGENRKLSELNEGIGGPHGSTYVDKNFLAFLAQKVTPEVITNFHDQNPMGYLELMEKWEDIKIHAEPGKSRNFPLPSSLYKFLLQNHKNILKKLEQEQGEDEYLLISAQDMQTLFQPQLNGIGQLIEQMLQKAPNHHCDYIYLVGGFSTSPFVREYVEKFSSQTQKIVKPPTPGAAIVEGAVMYALNPIFPVRCSRLTYGTSIISPFEKSIDKISKRRSFDHLPGDWCIDRFLDFVRIGDPINVEDAISREIGPGHPEQTGMEFIFYTTKKYNPRYIDEEDVQEIDKIFIKRENFSSGMNWKVIVTMYFGRTEIQVEVKDMDTNKIERTTLRLSYTYSSEVTI